MGNGTDFVWDPWSNSRSFTSSQLLLSGFRIVGDMLDEAPEGLILAHRNGGSLEKGVANITLVRICR